MEYIHKAKAEKLRTKALSDQMEARRTKNKVPHFQIPSDRKSDSPFPFRLLGNVGPRGLQRRGKHSWQWMMHQRRSKFPHTTHSHMSSLLLYAMHRMFPANLHTRPFHHITGLRISIECMTSGGGEAPNNDALKTWSWLIIVPLLSWTALTLDSIAGGLALNQLCQILRFLAKLTASCV